MPRRSFSKLLGGLLPAGVLGLSAALAPCAGAVPRPTNLQDAAVAARLSAVRAAVTTAVLELPPDGTEAAGVQKVWWGNHGWGRPWRWGGGGWRNGGWGNGGWRNGGWGNWHPWGNGGWGNWHP